MKQLKELVRVEEKKLSYYMDNLNEACRRLNKSGDHYRIDSVQELNEVLRDSNIHLLKLLGANSEVRNNLLEVFKCNSFTELTAEERKSGLFERTLKQYVDHYSYIINEVTRGRNELPENVSTTGEYKRYWVDSLRFLSCENGEWSYNEEEIKEHCSLYATDINNVEAIKRLKDWDRYRNSSDTPEWFKLMFPQLAKGDWKNKQIIDDNGNVTSMLEYYGYR